eukprot:1109411-Rhodomonas_salina.2
MSARLEPPDLRADRHGTDQVRVVAQQRRVSGVRPENSHALSTSEPSDALEIRCSRRTRLLASHAVDVRCET